jgi:hypothetical protein
LGLLQNLSRALAGGLAGLWLTSFFGPAATAVLPTAAFDLLLILIAIAIYQTGSLFVQFLRAAGFRRAPRSDATVAALNPFATPLKMSCIALTGT